MKMITCSSWCEVEIEGIKKIKNVFLSHNINIHVQYLLILGDGVSSLLYIHTIIEIL